jgi:transcriptional regulator with XRE-family HTH domain
MNFQELQESVRAELQRRVDSGRITASSLARQVGFKQAHISNFLNRRRALSLEGLDRVLAAQKLTVEELLPLELQGAAVAGNMATEPSEAIPVVAPWTAMEDPVVRPGAVIETVHVPVARLSDGRVRTAARYQHWQRFVAIRADAQQASAMEPLILPESLVVLDRQYRSLAPYRAHQKTVYAVRTGAGLLLRFVEFAETWLLLRPLSMGFPLQMVSLGAEESAADYIVGRVALVMNEL